MPTLVEVLQPQKEADKVASGKVMRQIGNGKYVVNAGGHTSIVSSHVGALRPGELISVMKIGDASAAVNSRGMSGMSSAQWMLNKPGYGRVIPAAVDPNTPELPATETTLNEGRVYLIDG